ncbi:Alpha/Beta hydrolase protein [Kickxella alabastrina]|uniref:Alpha/Beta hydrolase protein n=1 Tax=Kickxella alabastrina TaxID=61397 RepID=UPI00222114EA|nr:Alpha/Beta hydrolase protein [Kickxella alabastrina]KAI7835227.1 Alpha/Beta hydrolase protein [Kickxella alabastrina]
MLDHILGKPSANIRRTQVLGTALLTAILLQRQKRAPWGLRWLAQLDTKLPIWKALLCWSTILYVLRHMDDLLGLHAPEPLREYYSRSFYRATWIFTALDAGFWTAMSVRPRPLRHILSLLFSVYYLIFTNRGVEKVRKVRALITVDHLRVSWNKGVDNPLLRLIMRLRSSKLTVNRVVSIPRLSDVAQLEPAKCHIMYAGPEGEFKSCRHVVLNFPGGGFVAMGPDCHKDYLSAWAERTQAVVVSVDYAKAPEYPYPYAIDQCYEVYRDIVQTNGRCLGLQQPEPLRIVLAGDSAGGNITASVMFRILESSDRLPVPEGIVFIYGCFNVDICAWMTRQETRMLLGASESRPVYVDDRVRVVRKTAAAPLSRNSSDDEDDEDKNNGNIRSSDSSGSDVERAFVPAQTSKEIGYVPLSMTSSFTYFNDQILSPEMMRAMIIMYVGPNGRPNFRTDYYLSPLVAPDHLLERFPPVYFMCGEKDPMVDDTVLFAARIRKAKQRRMQAASPAKKPNKGDRRPLAAVIKVKLLAGMSHGFMQMYSLLPESKQVAATLGGWLVELLYGDHTMTAYSRCASMVYNSGPHCQQQQQQQLHGADYVSSSSSSSWEIGPNVGNIVLRNGHGPNRHRSVVDDLISIEITSPPLPSTSPTLAVTAAAASFSMNAAAPGISADIFERGLLDKHGIEIVSSANMVRRRGHGLADPLN